MNDRIFTFVLAVILINLVLDLSYRLASIPQHYASSGLWVTIIINTVAVIGVLWLLRTARKRRLYVKKSRQEEDKPESQYIDDRRRPRIKYIQETSPWTQQNTDQQSIKQQDQAK